LKVVTILGKENCQRCQEVREKYGNEPDTTVVYIEFATLPLVTRRKITGYFRSQGREFEYPLVIEGKI